MCVLMIVDVLSKLSDAIDVRLRYMGADVVATLEQIVELYGVRRRSVWTMVLNSSRANSTCGYIEMRSCWISRTLASPPSGGFQQQGLRNASIRTVQRSRQVSVQIFGIGLDFGKVSTLAVLVSGEKVTPRHSGEKEFGGLT
jgi:hypothetical protein